METRFERDVRVCLPHHERGQGESDCDEHDTGIKRIRSQPVSSGDPTREQRGASDGQVPGEFVQAHRQPAPLIAHEIDLHDHGG